jgi:hypothetical protein
MTDYIRQSGTNVCFPKDGKSWVILSDIEQRIKEKIERIGKPLKDWDVNIYRGILTGCNEAFIIDKAKRNTIIKKDSKSAEIIRPILRGRDIKRYGYEFADQYIIATFPSKKYDIDNYPAVRDYLLSYGKKKLEQSGKPGARKKTSHKWFETQDSIAYWDDFSKQKIIYPGIMRIAKSNPKNFPRFALDIKEHFLFGNDCYFIVGENIGYLWLFFNSTLFGYLFRYYIYSFDKTGFKIFTEYVQNIPIPKPNDLLLKNSIKPKMNEIDIKAIDKWIYGLYDFSDNEISEIDNSVDELLKNIQ